MSVFVIAPKSVTLRLNVMNVKVVQGHLNSQGHGYYLINISNSVPQGYSFTLGITSAFATWHLQSQNMNSILRKLLRYIWSDGLIFFFNSVNRLKTLFEILAILLLTLMSQISTNKSLNRENSNISIFPAIYPLILFLNYKLLITKEK